MKRKCVFSGLVLGTLLIAYEGNSWANGEYREPIDLRASNQAPKQATTSLFSNLLEMILAIRQSEPVPVEPQYRLVFSVGAGGKIVEPTTGFECVSECEVQLTDVLRTSYQVVPDDDYQFAGWSGDICNTPDEYLSSACDVSVGWKKLGIKSQLHVRAQFARKADVELAGSTEEFEVSSYGFGSFYADEMPPVTCYPTIDDCTQGDQAVWQYPHNYAAGDFNQDGFQDLLVIPHSNSGYSRTMKVRPTIFLNNRVGGLYRSDSIFADGEAAGMQFGYRTAIEDFNGDGKDDFVVGAMGIYSREPHNYGEFVPERYVIYLSGDDGKLHDGSDGIQGQENGAVMPNMSLAHDLATGDVDGDGDVDIWMGDKLFENDGRGGFDVNISLGDMEGPLEGYTMSSAIADFDGDNIGDLIVARADPTSEVWQYLSSGEANLLSRSKTLLPHGRFGITNTKHNHIAASDLDGDGDQDLVIGQTRSQPYYEGRELQILINDGLGNFSDETDLRLGDQSYYSAGDALNHGEGAVHLLDVNGDGFVDIFDRRGVASHLRSAPPHAGASIWLNDGAGNFTDVPPTVFPVVEPGDLAPHFGSSLLNGRLKDPTPIEIDNDGVIDIVSFVITSTYPHFSFKEATLYTLISRQKLRAGDYRDE